MQIWMHGVGEHGIIRFACEDRRSSIPGYMDFRMLLWMPHHPTPLVSDTTLVVRATLWFASAHSRLATKQLSAHRITMAAIQDLARVEDVIKAVHDMIPKDQHPYDWLREQVPAEQMPNYFAQLGALMDAAGAKPEWDMMLPVEVFDDPDGADLQVPLTLANFQMMTCVDDGKQMETCWRQHSKIRVMAVVEKTLLDKKGANTSMEKPALVAAKQMAGIAVGGLAFACAHGVGSTRLMGWHVLAHALVKLHSSDRPILEVTQVTKFLKSIAKMSVSMAVQDAAKRGRMAMSATAPLSTRGCSL